MVSWDTRILSSWGYSVFSHPEIYSGDQSNISLLATMFRNLQFTLFKDGVYEPGEPVETFSYAAVIGN